MTHLLSRPGYVNEGNYCAVCKTTSVLSHHLFPKNVDKRRKWASLLDIKESDLHSSSKVCSLHFSQESYSVTTRMKPRLQRDALPIQVLTASHPVQNVCPKTEHEEQQATLSTLMNHSRSPTPEPVLTAVTVNQVTPNNSDNNLDFSTQKRSYSKFKKVVSTLAKKRRQVNSLQSTILHLKKKLKTISELISYLRSEHLLPEDCWQMLAVYKLLEGNSNSIVRINERN